MLDLITSTMEIDYAISVIASCHLGGEDRGFQVGCQVANPNTLGIVVIGDDLAQTRDYSTLYEVQKAFAKCHSIYYQNYISDEGIMRLGELGISSKTRDT